MEQRRNPWGGAANGTIAFSHGDAVSSIFTVNADSTGQTNLTPETNASANSGPAWPPDGSKIAFESSAAGPPSEIYVVNTDGSNRMQLTASADEERTPAWSPDGSKIAFVRWLPAGQGQVLPKIYVMNADGSNQVQLRTETTFSEESPDWSPDGSKIVFVDAGGGSHIYTMNADGTDLTQLTVDNLYTRESPDWSPDGSKIVFGAYDQRTGGKYDIFVMNADGSGVRNLTNQPDFHDIRPVWSPDGTEIAFVRDPDADFVGDEGGASEIWRMDADGYSLTRVTSNTADDNSPDWQPIS